MSKQIRLLWAALAGSLLLLVLWQRYPLADAAARLTGLPERGLLYQTRPMALEGSEAANFHGTTVVKRLAAIGSSQVILMAVDGTHNRHAVHDPGFCFRGAGWAIAREETVALEHGEGRHLHLTQASGTAEALYWFSDGRRQFGSPLRYWWQTALRRLTLGRSGEEPVLVILTSTTAGPPDWPAVLRDWPELQQL